MNVVPVARAPRLLRGSDVVDELFDRAVDATDQGQVRDEIIPVTNQPFSDDVAADCTRQPDKNERQCDTQSWDVVFRSKDALDKGLSERVQPLEHQAQGYKRRHERRRTITPVNVRFLRGFQWR